jgi:AcrR family transcriptional regulator
VAEPSFLRARTSEQLDLRRETIISAAATALVGRPVRDVTLTSISSRAGIAPSGLLRYFESREAILCQVLLADIDEWLDHLERGLAAMSPDSDRFAAAEQLAGIVADSLVARPRLCELMTASAALLEHGINVETARMFKRRNLTQIERLVGIIERRLDGADQTAASQFATSVPDLVGGSWPHSHPSAAVASAIAEEGYPSASVDYQEHLRNSLANQLVGALARSDRRTLSSTSHGSARDRGRKRRTVDG